MKYINVDKNVVKNNAKPKKFVLGTKISNVG